LIYQGIYILIQIYRMTYLIEEDNKNSKVYGT